MRRNRNQKQRGPRRTRARGVVAPSSSVLRYNGPLQANPEQLAVFDLVYELPLASIGTSIANVFADYPSNSPDWTNCTAMFAEYRVLAMTLQYTPLVEGATIGALLYNVLYIVWDASNATAPLASYTAAANYPTKRLTSLNARAQISHKMTGVEEATFVNTASTVLDYSFKLYADTLTNNTTYGRITITYHTEFRGRL